MSAHFVWLSWTFSLMLHLAVTVPLDYPDSSPRNDSMWNYREVSRHFKANDIIDMDNSMFLLDRLSQDARSLRYCRRKATCQPLSNSTCLGAKLPYSSTTLELVPRLTSVDQITVSLRFCFYFFKTAQIVS